MPVMKEIIILFLFMVSLPSFASAQCTQGNGILRLMNLDTCRDNVAIVECLSKIQLSTTTLCSIQLQPNLKLASDGTFCEISRGVLSRGVAGGKYTMGKSDIAFQMTNPQSMQAPGMLVMNMKGRVVPNGGGRETQIDCNLLYNVTAGSALGVVSLGQDSLMGTTYTGPPLTAGGYMGAGMGGAGVLPGPAGMGMQQQGGMGMGMQQQQGMMAGGMGMVSALPGQQAMGGAQGQMYGPGTSAAAARLAGGSMLAALALALLLAS